MTPSQPGSERDRLVREITNAWSDDPWHGSPITDNLAGISARQAAARPIPGAHSIWEIVLHMTGWVREVARRLGGAPSAMPDGGDWPAVTDASPAAWRSAVADLGRAHEELIAGVATFPEARLHQPPGSGRSAALGTGVTPSQMLHGLVQHDAYHSGQIGLLRKAKVDTRRKAAATPGPGAIARRPPRPKGRAARTKGRAR